MRLTWQQHAMGAPITSFCFRAIRKCRAPVVIVESTQAACLPMHADTSL